MDLNFVNFFQTRLAVPFNPDDLSAVLVDADELQTPCYLVIDPAFPHLREVVLFDDGIVGNEISTSTLDNRFLAGSTEEENVGHEAGARVIMAFVAQHLEEIQSRLNALET